VPGGSVRREDEPLQFAAIGTIDATFVGRVCALARARALAVGTTGRHANEVTPAAFAWSPPGTWRAVAPPPVPIAPGPGALVALADGTAALLGIRSPRQLDEDNPTIHLFLYDAAVDTWREGAPLPSPREGFAATVLRDGTLLVFGGRRSFEASARVDLYDASRNIWRACADAPDARDKPAVTILRDSRVLVVGGVGPSAFRDAESSATTWVHDPASSTWHAAGSLAHARRDHAVAALPDGRVACLGGWAGAKRGLDSIEVFDPANQRWTLGGVLLAKRKGAAAGLLADGRVLITGGSADTPDAVNVYRSTEIWNPATGLTEGGPPMQHARAHHDLVTLSDGRLLVSGGAIGGRAAPAELLEM
jgi:hypothetical protein